MNWPMHKNIYKIIFVLVIAVFMTGLTELFWLRFQKGDVYPAYSSLRTDPLGSKVLFESLVSFNKLDVKRNYQSWTKLEGDPGSVLLYLGAWNVDFQWREKNFFQSLDQYMIQGGRLVIAFLPSQHLESHVKEKSVLKDKKIETPDPEEEQRNKSFDSMEKHWGIVLNNEDPKAKKQEHLIAKKFPQKQRFALEENLPQSLSWHSGMSFKPLNAAWHTLYTVNEKPVMVVKTLGRGSLILMTDSFAFSNEALLKDRQVPLLGALLQDRQEIIFDEYHLGVASQQGLMDLIVRYRLQYFLLSLFFVFALLVWKNSSQGIRESQDIFAAQLIESKKDYFEGLVSLLRKNIPKKKILNICVEEWYKDINHSSKKFSRGIKSDQGVKKNVEEILASQNKGMDPVGGYQLIYKKLTERKRYE